MTSPLIYFVSAVEMVYWGFGFFEMVFFCVALGVLELTLQTRFTYNLQRSTRLCLPEDPPRIKDVCYHHLACFYF